MIKPIKLQRSHVFVNKPLPWNVYDGKSQLLLRSGYIIENDEQLESLLLRGMFIDATDIERSERGIRVKDYNPFKFWDDMGAALGMHLMRPAGELDFPAHIVGLGRQVQYFTQRSADMAIGMMMMIRDHRRYSIVHSLHAAVLCELVAKRLGWEQPRRMDLLCAALTMNIGMLQDQQNLANQSTPLTADQQHCIRQHPIDGVNILRKAGVDSTAWLSAVEHHHETANGSGYPYGITDISEEAALLRTLDVFCAKISPRLHRKPMSGNQAARMLFAQEGMASNNPFIPSLIKEIGIYPPGSFVKLSNGETAIVQKRSPKIEAPHVISLLNPQGLPIVDPIHRDISNSQCKIKGEVPREFILIEINPEKIWAEASLARYG